MERLEKLQVEFKKTKPSERKPVRAQFAKLLKEGEALQPKIIEAAQAAYKAAPTRAKP